MSQPAMPTTPVRDALVPTSPLLERVKDGLQALTKDHRAKIDQHIVKEFADSLDLDAALQPQFPNDNRWDYLLGHGPSRKVVGFEPHSAKDAEVKSLVKKKKAAMAQLTGHLKQGRKVAAWLWVAGENGKVKFAKTERIQRQLDENGITFVGKQLRKEHLPI